MKGDTTKAVNLTTVVYTVHMIPVENRDTHILSPVAERKYKYIHVNIPRIMTMSLDNQLESLDIK